MCFHWIKIAKDYSYLSFTLQSYIMVVVKASGVSQPQLATPSLTVLGVVGTLVAPQRYVDSNLHSSEYVTLT